MKVIFGINSLAAVSKIWLNFSLMSSVSFKLLINDQSVVLNFSYKAVLSASSYFQSVCLYA